MTLVRKLWTVTGPVAIGGIVGFAVTSAPGCSERSDDEPDFGPCDCETPAPATYVLEPSYEEAPDGFPQLVGALFTVNDYEWQAPYHPDAPNVVLSYVESGDEVIVEFSYAKPETDGDALLDAGGATGQGGARGDGP